MIDRNCKNSKPETYSIPEPARDLLDFHLRWPEFRPVAANLAQSEELSDIQRTTLKWLIELAERVGAQDVNPQRLS